MKKKDVPLDILKVLEPFIKVDNDFVKSIIDKNLLLKLVDKDSESGFYFHVEGFATSNQGKYCL